MLLVVLDLLLITIVFRKILRYLQIVVLFFAFIKQMITLK